MEKEMLIRQILELVPVKPASPDDPVFDRIAPLLLESFKYENFFPELLAVSELQGRTFSKKLLAALIDDLMKANMRLQDRIAALERDKSLH